MGEPAENSAPAFHTRRVRQGRGEAVVLIHGVGLDLEMWSAQAESLAGGFSVLRYDLPGHGATPPRPGALGLEDLGAQLAALLDEENIARASLVGFSLGALAAQAFALTHPDRVTRLALVCGVYDRDAAAREAVSRRLRQAERDGPESIIEAALERWFSRAYRDAHAERVEAIRQRQRANSPRGFLPAYRLFARADAQLAGRLGDICAPALVITGADDSGSTPDMARRMSEAIPNAECKVIPGVRHMLPLEAAEALNAMLIPFLSGREPRS